ncbi:MAG TPA: maleylacetoacetate isomerase [Burkholderiaceae bacterium]
MAAPVFYSYFRSSAAWRVRIALNLKGLRADYRYVHLNRGGGEQFKPEYRALQPQALVPAMRMDNLDLGQSLAIIEYLDERHPEPPLLPGDAAGRARVRQIALAIACDIHPLNNLRVLKHLAGRFGASEEDKAEWARHWITLGLSALEEQLAGNSGRFCVGNSPTMADCCLVPQWFSAQRFGVDVAAFPTLGRIVGHCQALPAFAEAHATRQADAE